VASTDQAPAARRHTTLGARLVLIFTLFSVVPLFFSNLWGYLQSREYLTENALRNVRNVAALEASQTLVFVENKRDLVPLIVAGNLQLFGLLRALQSQTDPDIVATLEKALRKQLAQKAAEDDDAQEFFVVSPQGLLMASTDETHGFGTDLSRERCFQAGKAGPRIVGFEYTHEQPTLVVAAPVDDEFGTQWGVLCARFRFNLHKELAAGQALRTPEGSLFLIDAGGKVVDAAVGEGVPLAVGTKLARPFAVVGGSPGWDARYAIDGGEDAIGAYAPVPDLGWGVLVEVPVSRALANLARLKWQAAVAGAVLMVLLVVMVLVAARGLSLPIRRLSEAARLVESGSLGERVSTDGPREVSDLANTFNRMSLALRDSHQLLEQRVADATRELRQNQEFTELLLNSIDQRVVVIDPALKIIKANRVALQAWGADVVGRACDEVSEGGRLVCEAAPVRSTFVTGQATSTERSERAGDAAQIVRLDTLPLVGTDRAVEAVILVGRVVTQEKRRQAELLHHEKMSAFGLLAAGVAHEIGNPLASIAAQLRMNREATDPERVRQTFAVVEREVDRVSRLLRDLVTFARRKRDDVTLVQLNDVVEDVSRLVGHDQRARGIKIEKRLASPLPGVRAKEDQLMQVLLNLSLNAIDAMGERGTLTIETSSAEGVVTARVIDTGPGIPAEVLPRVFEAFFTTKEAGRGTGLGLFVSRDLIEALGGKLEVERTGPEGTVFAVKLPLKAKAGA
jgi:C4-dicarboxylate-specific signal transduction histidine kinase